MLGNISGEGFDDWVYKQITQRQKVYGSVNRTPEQLLYLNGRTSWVRLISSVNFENGPYYKNNEGTKKLQDIGLNDSLYIGSVLAQEFVLFAGTSQTLGQNPQAIDLRQGIAGTNPLNQATGLDSTFNNAYGIGGNEFGIQPMPTLGNVEIKYKNRGSLKEANLTIKCFNKKQFEIIESLYLRLGYTVLLEWGNSCYFDNDGVFQKDNLTSLQNYMFDNAEVKNGHFALLSKIAEKREEAAGNYDAIYAKVSNYSWTFEEGVYNINVKLMSLGDIVESLKVNFLTPSSQLAKKLSSNSDSQEEDSQEENPEIEDAREFLAFYKDHSDLSRLFYNASVFGDNEKDVVKITKEATNTVKDSIKQLFSFTGGITGFFENLIDIGKNFAQDAKNLIKKVIDVDGFQLIPFAKALKKTYSSKDLSNLSIDVNNTVYKDTAFLSVNYQQGLLSNIFYIQFGALLEFLEKTQLLYNPQKGTSKISPLISIDYLPNTNFMVSEGKTISSDPRICLVNPNVEGLGITKALPPFKYKLEEKYQVGALMNVYVNTRFILEKTLELEDEKGNVSLFNILKAICDGINYSLGNVNSLTPFYDGEFNSLKIIDEASFPDSDGILEYLRGSKPNVVPLQLFGYDPTNAFTTGSSAGFVKNYGIKTEITNDLATTVTIGAQAANKPIKGIDATAFGAWNRGLIDRIIPYKLELSDEKTKEDANKELPSTFEEYKKQLREKYKDIISNYVELEQSFKGEGQVDFDFDNIPAYNTAVKGYRDYLKELDSYDALKKSETETLPPITAPSFLPINLNLELDGLSGPLILQKLEVNTSFLPNPIPNTLSFLIKGISHNIVNNVWTTKYDTISIPKFLTAKKEDTTQTEKVNGEKPKTQTDDRVSRNNCEVLIVDGFETPPIYEGKAIRPPKRNSSLRMNLDTRREILPILESDEFKRKYTKGHRMIALAYAIKEGYKKGSRSYVTLNPGNIGNTDSGARNPQPSLRKGIELLMNYFETRANGTEPGWEFGPKTIPQYYSKEIANNPKTYQRPNGCLPGYTGDYQGQIGYFVKRYATFARVNNNGISALMTIFSINGYPSKIDGNTLLSDLLAYNPPGDIKLK